jgi:DNA repair exonuclease SbcCD ATPase subunit
VEPRVDIIIILGGLGGLATALLGWVLGRAQASRWLREAGSEATYFRRKAAEAEREMASLRVKREHKIVELLEQVRLLESDRLGLMGAVSGLKVEREGLEDVLRTERLATRDKVGLLQDAVQRLEGIFRALSGEAVKLGDQTQALDQLIRPLQDSLERYDGELREMERRRVELYDGLRERLEAVTGAQQRLQLDTGSFVQALLYERLTKLLEYFEELRRALERGVITELPPPARPANLGAAPNGRERLAATPATQEGSRA